MHRRLFLTASVLIWGLFPTLARSEENRPNLEPAADQVRDAIQRAIPLLEQGSAGSAEHRSCFTCHNLGVPFIALTEARKKGFAVNSDNLQRLAEHTYRSLVRDNDRYVDGRGPGGESITAGYALWTLEVAQRKPDDTTAAVTGYLVSTQRDLIHWRHPNERPPSAGSDFTTTYVALRGLDRYGSKEKEEEIAARVAEVADWLVKEQPHDTEDEVFRLWGLIQVGADSDVTQAAIDKLQSEQRSDGGWAQTGEMESDAYATGTALAVLLETGSPTSNSEPIQRGIQFLLKTQLADGTWHVVTRAKPFQTYYESGFPHGKDQFISMAASAWATYAMALTLPALESQQVEQN